MSRILVTGISGFLGSAIAQNLADRGEIVYGIGSSRRREGPPVSVEGFSQADWNTTEFRDFVEEASADIVVHCAGSSSVGRSVEDPAADFAGNVELTRLLLEALRTGSKSSRVILLSSAAVYGNPDSLPVSESAPVRPISPYGFHKRQAELLIEEYVQVYGMQAGSLRIFSAYGPGLDRQVLWDLSRKITSSGPVEMHGDGSETRDFVHSADVARAVFAVAKNAPLAGEIYNVASGVECRISKLLEMLLSEFGAERDVTYSGGVGEGVPRKWRGDIGKLRELGFEPSIVLADGVKEYVKWFSEKNR